VGRGGTGSKHEKMGRREGDTRVLDENPGSQEAPDRRPGGREGTAVLQRPGRRWKDRL